MALNFKTICSVIALMFLLLCLTLNFLPQLVYWLFAWQGNDLGDFMSKRAGMLFLGLSALCLLARDTTSNEVKRLLSASVGAAMAGLAVLGLFELMRGNAGWGILVAVVVEIAIVWTLLRVWQDAK